MWVVNRLFEIPPVALPELPTNNKTTSEVLTFFQEAGSVTHRRVIEALFHAAQICDSDIVATDCCPATGLFSIDLKRPYSLKAPILSEEAPAGFILLFHHDVETGKTRTIKGRVTRNSLSFSDGLVMFVKTNKDKLSMVNRRLLRIILALPQYLRNKLLSLTNTNYDPTTGSIETYVSFDKLTFRDDSVIKNMRLYNSRRTVPTKQYLLEELISSWSHATGIPDDQRYVDVLRQAYANVVT